MLKGAEKGVLFKNERHTFFSALYIPPFYAQQYDDEHLRIWDFFAAAVLDHR